MAVIITVSRVKIGVKVSIGLLPIGLDDERTWRPSYCNEKKWGI